MRLSEAKVGDNLKVINIDIKNSKLKNYLMGLGLVNDTYIKIVRKSLFNGPIIIELRGYQLCIYNNDIEVDYI